MASNYVDVANQTGWTQASTDADNAAKAAYNQGMLQYNNDTLALAKAKQAWQETMDKAGLTGQYQGQWTMPVQQWQASTFGTWGAPTAGQQTQAAQQQGFAQQQALANLYGQGYSNWAGVPQGQQTLAAQQQNYSQWLQSQQEARAAQAQQQSQAQSYLNLLSSLRGPADWAKYQQVLGSTPGGMRDLAAAAMGQYVPGGGATTGYQPQAASLQSMMGQISGQPYAGQGGGQLNMPNVYGQNTAAAYGNAPGQQGAAGQAQQAAGNGTNVWGADTTQYNLPAPNQIAAQSWKNLAPSQQQMMLGQYEAAGWDKGDVTALMNQALPKYASNAPTAGTWRL